MKKLMLAVAALSLFTLACNKGGDTPTTPTNRKDTLTTGKWQMVSLNGTATIFGKDTTVDIYPSIDACTQDNFYLFGTNGSITNDEGATKCDAGDPQQAPGGTWTLSASKDTLVLTDATLPGKFRIVSFSNTTMKLQNDTTYLGFPAKLLATFQHQ